MMARDVQKEIEAIFLQILLLGVNFLHVLHVSEDETCQAVHALAVAYIAFEMCISIEDIEQWVCTGLMVPLKGFVLETAATYVGAKLLCQARRAHCSEVLIDLF